MSNECGISKREFGEKKRKKEERGKKDELEEDLFNIRTERNNGKHHLKKKRKKNLRGRS